MSEREEYTPDLGSIRAWYAGAVDEYRCDTGMSMDEGEAAFDRAIAARDRALREQVAREIEHKREVFSEAQLRILGHLPPVQSGIVAGYTYAARIARGEEQTDE